MQLIDSSEGADTLLSNVPEWDSNQLPRDYEPEVQTTTVSQYWRIFEDWRIFENTVYYWGRILIINL